MVTSNASFSAPLPPSPSKRKPKPKAPNTAAIWDNLASARGGRGKGKEKEPEQDKQTETEGDKDKEEELETEKNAANDKENANETGEKDMNEKEVSLPIDSIALRVQSKPASLQPVTPISTQRKKKEMGTATTMSENGEKQARFAPLSMNGHTSCTPLLNESISTSRSRRSNRLKEPNAKKAPPEPAKLKVRFES